MTLAHKHLAGNVLGGIAMGLLPLPWLFMLAPPKWNLRLPGGMPTMALNLILPFILALLATKLAARAWIILALISLGSLIYLGFFVRSPWWS
jgi:hypothetical protein